MMMREADCCAVLMSISQGTGAFEMHRFEICRKSDS